MAQLALDLFAPSVGVYFPWRRDVTGLLLGIVQYSSAVGVHLRWCRIVVGGLTLILLSHVAPFSALSPSASCYPWHLPWRRAGSPFGGIFL